MTFRSAKQLAAGLMACAALLATGAGSAQAVTKIPTHWWSTKKRAVKPSTIHMDDGQTIVAITWTRWGTHSALGEGGVQPNCRPGPGGVMPPCPLFPVTLYASSRHRCGGEWIFEKLRIGSQNPGPQGGGPLVHSWRKRCGR